MTNTVFSTVDRFASKFKLMDSLINTVTARLLPQQEAKADGCPAGTYYAGWSCGDYCRPTGDSQWLKFYFCNTDPYHSYMVTQCCDCCS
jgi:hypothetical protein